MADITDDLQDAEGECEQDGRLGSMDTAEDNWDGCTAFWDDDLEGQSPRLSFKQEVESFLRCPNPPYQEREAIVCQIGGVFRPNYLPKTGEKVEIALALKAMGKLSNDEDSAIRTSVAVSISEVLVSKLYPDTVTASALMSLVCDLLRDDHELTRSTCRTCIVSSVENDPQLCLVLQKLLIPQAGDSDPFSNPSPGDTAHENFVLEFLALVAEIAMLFESAFCETELVSRIKALCESPNFRIRKACVGTLSAVARVLSPSAAIDSLTSNFFTLAKDDIWGVRKACAEHLATISKVVTSESRHDTVTQCFCTLAQDESRWVRCAAYKNLGSLIATFVAEPPEYDELVRRQVAMIELEASEVQSATAAPATVDTRTGAAVGADTAEAPGVASGTMPIVATGVWRSDPTRFEALKQELQMPVRLLEQDDEAELAALCAFEIIETQGLGSGGVTLFVEGGRGSTQFVVVDSTGVVLHKAYADGFPKVGISYDRKKAAAAQVHTMFGDQITLIVAFGALWYIHENNGAPVLGDKADLPAEIVTCGRDFPMEFLTESFQDTKMTVIRNVTTPDGKIRKITWGGGLDAAFIDLGSGKAAVIDPITGGQSQNSDLPDSVPEIAALLKTMVATALTPSPKVPPLKLDGLDIEDVSTDDTPDGESTVEDEEGLGELRDLGPGGSKTAIGRKETRATRRVSPAPWDIAKFTNFLEAEANASPAINPSAAAEPEEKNYNSFSFWKAPLPSFDLAGLLESLAGDSGGAEKGDRDSVAAPKQATSAEKVKPIPEDITVPDTMAACQEEEPRPPVLAADEASPVPMALIEHFKIMAQQISTKNIDSDIVRTCAFSIPAVVWALGKPHWYHIRETYLMLAQELDWKIRSSIAHSCHVCALILGRAVTEEDLLPSFSEFLVDWEEVRDGAIKHFTDFIRVISPALRDEYLAFLVDLSQVEDSHNWRRRRAVVDQLGDILGILAVETVVGTVQPVLMTLVFDRVAFVRNLTHETIATLLHRLEGEADQTLATSLVDELIASLACSEQSIHRQGFAYVCRHLQARSGVAFFVSMVFESLLRLAADMVPNVKIIVAKMFVNMLATGYLAGQDAEKDAKKAIETLKIDSDRDVAFYAGGGVRAFPNGLVPTNPVDFGEIDGESSTDEHKPVPAEGKTALYAAAKAGDLPGVRELAMTSPASVTQPANDGSTPLWVAACNGHFEMVQWLASNGGSVTQPDSNGNTPLAIARQQKHAAVVRFLEDNGAV